MLWILALETSPDSWLDNLIGGHEMIIGMMKAFGLVLVLIMAVQQGVKPDRFNPGFGFAAMFLMGLIHGLYPGLSLVDSVRSLIGSAGPFLFGFVRLPPPYRRVVIRACIWGPLFTVGFGALLAVSRLDHMYVVEQGAIRLGASGQPPFLAGFALIAIYAGLMDYAAAPTRRGATLILLNFLILLLTGARTPLALACFVTLGYLLSQRRLLTLAAAGALASFTIMFLNTLTFLRVVTMAQLGQADNLSNRDLVWPSFRAAFAQSPWVGWGVGAGKAVIPVTSHLTALIGTNAAHDEYLRIGSEGGVVGETLLIALMVCWVLRGSRHLPAPQKLLMRLVFIGFALHSATDNTLIATTSSVFFIWVSVLFASAAQEVKGTHDYAPHATPPPAGGRLVSPSPSR
jgi:O-antigen ligase